MWRAIVVVAGLAACGGEKITTDACVEVWDRAGTCMVESAPPSERPMVLRSEWAELTGELCRDADTRQIAASSQACLEAKTCETFAACFRASGRGEGVLKRFLRPPGR